MKPGIPGQRNLVMPGTISLLEEVIVRGYREDALELASYHATKCRQASEILLCEYQQELARVTHKLVPKNP